MGAGCVAGAEAFEDDAAEVGDVVDGLDGLGGDAGEYFKDCDVGGEVGVVFEVVAF